MNEQSTKEGEKGNFEPHKNDVLCGRGGSINNHIGNENYRIFVNRKKKVYLTARFKREKRLIAASIVKEVRSLDPPGRFLAKDNRSGQWYDIGDLKARDKTSQALREGAPEIRKEMESDLKKQRAESKRDSDSDGDDYEDDVTSPGKGPAETETADTSMDTSWEQQPNETMQRAVARMNIHDEDPWKQQHHQMSPFQRNGTYDYNNHHMNDSPHHHNNNGSHYPQVDPYAHPRNAGVEQGRESWYPMHPPTNSHHNQHYDNNRLPHRDHIISPIKTQYPPNLPRVHFREDPHDSSQSNYHQSAYDNNPSMPPPPPTLSNLRMPHETYNKNAHNTEPYSDRFAYDRSNSSTKFSRDVQQNQNGWGSQNGTTVGKRSEMEHKHKTYANMSRPEEIYQYMNVASGSRNNHLPSPINTRDTRMGNASSTNGGGFNYQSRRHGQVNVKRKPQRSLAQKKQKEIVETRAEPQDWLCSAFFPTSFFGGDDASFCGFDMCSVNSIGGSSLCGVFIEDDPNRNQEVELASRNQILKEAKSWGSIRSKSTLG